MIDRASTGGLSTIELTRRELTCLLLALGEYEARLLSFDGEDMQDRTADLLFLQSLRQKLKGSEQDK